MSEKTCSIEGCQNKVKSRGWCHNHYERWRRNGHPTVSVGKKKAPKRAVTEKRCALCKKVKPAEDFYSLSRKGTTFLSAYCKPCQTDYYRAKNLAARDGVPAKLGRKKKEPVPCAFEGCHNMGRSRLKGKGDGLYCGSHWNQANEGKELTVLRQHYASEINEHVRRCTGCDEIKPNTAFHMHSSKRYRQGRCKVCYGKVVRFNERVRSNEPLEALRVAETMPERLRTQYLGKWATLFNEAVRSDSTTSADEEVTT